MLKSGRFLKFTLTAASCLVVLLVLLFASVIVVNQIIAPPQPPTSGSPKQSASSPSGSGAETEPQSPNSRAPKQGASLPSRSGGGTEPPQLPSSSSPKQGAPSSSGSSAATETQLPNPGSPRQGASSLSRPGGATESATAEQKPQQRESPSINANVKDPINDELLRGPRDAGEPSGDNRTAVRGSEHDRFSQLQDKMAERFVQLNTNILELKRNVSTLGWLLVLFGLALAALAFPSIRFPWRHETAGQPEGIPKGKISAASVPTAIPTVSISRKEIREAIDEAIRPYVAGQPEKNGVAGEIQDLRSAIQDLRGEIKNLSALRAAPVAPSPSSERSLLRSTAEPTALKEPFVSSHRWTKNEDLAVPRAASHSQTAHQKLIDDFNRLVVEGSGIDRFVNEWRPHPVDMVNFEERLKESGYVPQLKLNHQPLGRRELFWFVPLQSSYQGVVVPSAYLVKQDNLWPGDGASKVLSKIFQFHRSNNFHLERTAHAEVGVGERLSIREEGVLYLP